MFVNGAVLIGSEQACKTDALAGSSDQACLSAASWSLVWRGAEIRSPAEIIGKNAITDTLQVLDEHFTSSVELMRVLFCSRNRLRTLIDVILLLDVHCHVKRQSPARARKRVQAGCWHAGRSLRVRLHCSQNRHNTTVWTDSRQGSRNQKHYCLCQRLH